MRMSRTYRRATGAAYHRADVVFVLGERSQRELEETWPGVRRIVQIPHGSGPSLEARSVPTADAAPPCVLFFGTWARYKGLDLLLDAFEIVRRSRPDAQLVVAGGVTKDTDLDAVAKAARRIGGVDLRPGYVPSQDVSRLFESARVVALPYSIANYSGVADLAHAHARPVVMTDVGDLRQAVASGGGVVVPPADPDRFAAALVSMLNDPARAASEGNRGQARVANAWTRTAEHFMAAYRPLADDARSAAVSS